MRGDGADFYVPIDTRCLRGRACLFTKVSVRSEASTRALRLPLHEHCVRTTDIHAKDSHTGGRLLQMFSMHRFGSYVQRRAAFRGKSGVCAAG